MKNCTDSGDLKNLNFTEYIENLSNDLYQTYTIDKSLVKLELDIEDIKLDVEISVPLGLILNELLTNSLKHAFPEGEGGVIKVECIDTMEDTNYLLAIME